MSPREYSCNARFRRYSEARSSRPSSRGTASQHEATIPLQALKGVSPWQGLSTPLFQAASHRARNSDRIPLCTRPPRAENSLASAPTHYTAIPRSAPTNLQANRGTTVQCGNALNSLRMANSRSCRHSSARYSKQRPIERGTATESHSVPDRRVLRTASLVHPLTTRL